MCRRRRDNAGKNIVCSDAIEAFENITQRMLSVAAVGDRVAFDKLVEERQKLEAHLLIWIEGGLERVNGGGRG